MKIFLRNTIRIILCLFLTKKNIYRLSKSIDSSFTYFSCHKLFLFLFYFSFSFPPFSLFLVLFIHSGCPFALYSIKINESNINELNIFYVLFNVIHAYIDPDFKRIHDDDIMIDIKSKWFDQTQCLLFFLEKFFICVLWPR